MAAFFLPLLKAYQVLLFPLAKPTALFLDGWLGREAIPYFRERDLGEIIKMHIISEESEIDLVEGRGALNFLKMDDLPVRREGESLDSKSIVSLPFDGDIPRFPQISSSTSDPFLVLLESSGKKWVVITDTQGEPRVVLDSDGFIRAALFGRADLIPFHYCHRPIMVKDPNTSLGDAISRFKVRAKVTGDDVIDEDIILYWAEEKRVLTGADVLGRLLRGIAHEQSGVFGEENLSTA